MRESITCAVEGKCPKKLRFSVPLTTTKHYGTVKYKQITLQIPLLIHQCNTIQVPVPCLSTSCKAGGRCGRICCRPVVTSPVCPVNITMYHTSAMKICLAKQHYISNMETSSTTTHRSEDGRGHERVIHRLGSLGEKTTGQQLSNLATEPTKTTKRGK